MRELARRRRGRDLRISRGHLWAAAAGCTLIAVGAFLVGFRVGSARSGAPPVVAVAPADGSLVELLARVNELSLSGDAAERLTFPDTLAGVGGEHTLPEAPTDDHLASVAPGEPGKRPFELLIAPEQAASRPAVAQAIGALGLASESAPDGPLVVKARDLAQARALRDQLVDAFSESELEVEISVRPVASGAVAAD